MLNTIAHELKQRDGESWAIGDLVEKAILLHEFETKISKTSFNKEKRMKGISFLRKRVRK